MNKLPYAKYIFSLWIVAIIAGIVAKFVSESLLVLVPLSITLFWLSVKSLARVRGYE
jgi:hypothetical protein